MGGGTVGLDELMAALDADVDPERLPDFAPNGLQVRPEGWAGGTVVRRVALGVSANRELAEAAAAWGADLVLTHHGLFGLFAVGEEPDPGRPFDEARAAQFRERGLGLAAYHLPLDAHPEVGNNAEIARALGLTVVAHDFGDLPETDVKVGLTARADPPVPLATVIDRATDAFGAVPLVVAAGPEPVRTAAIVSGGGTRELYAAIARGLDLFVCGEGREWTYAIAKEAGITFLVAGHHASETFGVRALGHWLERRFGVETRYFPQANPF